MKKSTFLVVLALLCLNINIKAQKAVNLSKSGIKIGEQMPDVLLKNILHYATNSAKLSSFSGKPIILDFWASWCAPCLQMMPHMEKLQRKFKDQIQFISVNYESKEVVEKTLKKIFKIEKSIVPHIVSDTILHKLLPHVYLPHYVWLDKTGKVMAFTDYQELTERNISAFIQEKAVLKNKEDMFISYNPKKLMLNQGNFVLEKPLMYSSLLTRYREGAQAGRTMFPVDSILGQRFTAVNLALVEIFKKAYSNLGNFNKSNTFINVNEPIFLTLPKDKGQYDGWRKNYSFCYEKTIPATKSLQIFDEMQKDLSNYFPQYSASVVNKKMKCLALVKKGAGKAFIYNQGGEIKRIINADYALVKGTDFYGFIQPLYSFYLSGLPYPIVDATGYKGMINIEVVANLKNVEEINRALIKYDLALELKEMETPVLLINDTEGGQSNEK